MMKRHIGGGYGLGAFESICSDLLSLYGEVFILGDFNVNLLDTLRLSRIYLRFLCSIMLLFCR
jgi:hypothetical protein